jgi:hypothetical protein
MHRSLFPLGALALATFPACIVAAGDDLMDDTAVVEEDLARTITPANLPNHLTFGHLDDAVGTDLIQYDQHRLFVTSSAYGGAPVMHHFYPANITQLIVGDFALAGSREHGHDQVCAILAGVVMDCEAPSDDRSELWWWFSQINPIQSGEKVVVGDFTGDGAQDLLAYNPSTGGVRLLSRTQTGTFAPVTAFAPGNLTQFNLANKQVYAGEFGQTVGRADLLFVDASSGQVIRFDSATDSSGRTTFWWAFTTATGALATNEQVTVANVDGGTRDALLLRNPATGAIRIMRAIYDNTLLTPVPSSLVSIGQLPITTDSAILGAAKLSSHPSEPGQGRDDTLFFDRTTGAMISTESRYDGSKFTYWWSYTRGTPSQSGWLPKLDIKTALVLCKLADVSRTPDTAGIKSVMTGTGTRGVRDYLFEVSYGTLDIANANVSGWVTSSLKAADSSARKGSSGWKTGDYIADCAAKAGVDPSAYNGHVLVVLNDTNVAFQGIIGYGAAFDYDTVLRKQINQVSHETLHAFGLDHANDDTSNLCGGTSGGTYCDTSDVMGNPYNTDLVYSDGTTTGPELNALHRDALLVIPGNRIIALDPATAPAKTTVTLAPLEMPEAGGALEVRVRNGTSRDYSIEYRRSVLLDAATGTNGVQIHRADATSATATVLRTAPARTLTPGATVSVGAFSMHVDAFDAASGTATLTFTH